jgi:hypothetical protein
MLEEKSMIVELGSAQMVTSGYDIKKLDLSDDHSSQVSRLNLYSEPVMTCVPDIYSFIHDMVRIHT